MKKIKPQHLIRLSLLSIFLCSSLCHTAHAVGFNAKDAKINSLPKRAFPNPKSPKKSLQAIINDNAKAGAVITFATGKNGASRTYTLGETVIPSNIHLRIPPNVTLKLKSGKRIMFKIGDSTKKSENVTIQSTKGRFTVDFTGKKQNEAVRFVLTQFADNVMVQNVVVKDNKTKFCVIEPGEPVLGKFTKRLTVRNIRQTNGHAGYGIIQITRVTDAEITKLDGIGGVPLRIETHVAKGNKGATDLTARDITATNGRAAVTLSPHESDSVRVNITDVESKGCSYGVLAPRGFGNRKGKFTKTTVTNVKATYSKDKAQEILFKKARIMIKSEWNKFLGLKIVSSNNKKALMDLRENLTGPSLSGIFTTNDKASDISYKGKLQFLNFPKGVPTRTNESNHLGQKAIKNRLNDKRLDNVKS